MQYKFYSNPNQSRRAAIHEAGHAVIGYLLGISIREVHIIPDEFKETGGTTLWINWPGDKPIDEHWKILMFVYAGLMAEQLFFRDMHAAQEIEEDHSDGDYFRAALDQFPDDKKAAAWEAASLQVWKMLRNPCIHRTVVAVADLLMKKRRIHAGHLLECIGATMPRSKWWRDQYEQADKVVAVHKQFI